MHVISGSRLIEEFFAQIKDIEGVDQVISDRLRKLYETGSFTDKKIDNLLLEMRENHGKS